MSAGRRGASASRPRGGWGRQIETLLAALAGGWIVSRLEIPAGWLSGAMAGAALATGAGRGAQLAPPLRIAALALAGLALGSAVTPQMLSAVGRYPASLALMALSLTAGTAAAAVVVRATSGWSKATALFASVPGALSYVLALAPGAGADLARVSLVQLTRVFALIALAPLLVGGGGAPVGAAIPAGPEDGALWIAATLALGVPLGVGIERLGVGAGVMFGPLLIAALAHGSGLAPGRPPGWMLLAGQVMIGAWAGSRFHAFDLGMLRRAIAPVVGSLAATIAVAAMFAFVAAKLIGVSYAEAMVAFAPGGLEAMTVLALALGLDPLYVGAHHLARFFMISFALPIVARVTCGKTSA
jgi:hypothetical protein